MNSYSESGFYFFTISLPLQVEKLLSIVSLLQTEQRSSIPSKVPPRMKINMRICCCL